MQIQKSLDLNHPPQKVSNLQNTRSHHPPRKGGSNGLMPFGEGAKDLNNNSNFNFAKNNSYPSPKSQILGSSTLPSKKILGEGDEDRENNIIILL